MSHNDEGAGDSWPGLCMKTNRTPAATKGARVVTSPTSDSISPSLDALYKRPGFMLRRAHQISVSLFMLQPDALNVTTTQYGVLVILRACEGLDQISLAKKVGLDRSTTGLVVKKLEKQGYIVRIADPQDLRRKVIVLTAKGERKLESLKEVAARSQELALSAFTPAEAKQFLSLLTKFVQHFNETTRAPIIKDD
jgi:MarR family transcriptional regulator, lower aerobic nicotinate degradation pathway regulator